MAVRSTRFRVTLPSHSPDFHFVVVESSGCSYSFSFSVITVCRDYQRTGIWPVGSIIKNLNVFINRHGNNTPHNTYIHTCTNNSHAIDESIKSMPNSIPLNAVLFNQKPCWWERRKWRKSMKDDGCLTIFELNKYTYACTPVDWSEIFVILVLAIAAHGIWQLAFMM